MELDEFSYFHTQYNRDRFVEFDDKILDKNSKLTYPLDIMTVCDLLNRLEKDNILHELFLSHLRLKDKTIIDEYRKFCDKIKYGDEIIGKIDKYVGDESLSRRIYNEIKEDLKEK